jgi:hypothetical protein
MGIRFFCPSGHKLNVKEFQAGRRGICPFCGARIQIPTHSTRPSTNSARELGGLAPTRIMEREDLESAQASDSSPEILPGEPPSLPGDPVGGKIVGPSTHPSGSLGSGSVVAPPTTPSGGRGAASGSSTAMVGGASLRAGPFFSSVASPSPPPMVAGPLASAHAASAQAPVSPGAVVVGSMPPSTPVPTPAPAPSAAPAPPAAPESPDAIAEAPEMIWYVRPPSGGQFGPATGDLMRTWLNEGRVSADSLVWREGWRDWQEAGKVFANLRGGQIMDFLETEPVANVAGAPAASIHRPKVRRSSDGSQIALLVVLGLLVVVLFVVFLVVLLH